MAYDTLIREAQDLPEDLINQVIEFMRFLKNASKEPPAKQSVSTGMTFHRSVNPLEDEFISISEDFDETPNCFKKYKNQTTSHNSWRSV